MHLVYICICTIIARLFIFFLTIASCHVRSNNWHVSTYTHLRRRLFSRDPYPGKETLGEKGIKKNKTYEYKKRRRR